MSWLLERRLKGTTRRLQRARQDLAVAEEQLLHFDEESGDAAVRALVSDDPEARLDSRDASGHRDAMARHRDDLRTEIQRLEARQDELLDQLSAHRRG